MTTGNKSDQNYQPHTPSSAKMLDGSSRQEWGDGKSTAATPEGAAKLTADAASPKNLVGFSGSQVRRRWGGPVGLILDFLFGKDPNIFDAHGRVRHQFSDEKWKKWDERLRSSKDYDWKNHSGRKS